MGEQFIDSRKLLTTLINFSSTVMIPRSLSSEVVQNRTTAWIRNYNWLTVAGIEPESVGAITIVTWLRVTRMTKWQTFTNLLHVRVTSSCFVSLVVVKVVCRIAELNDILWIRLPSLCMQVSPYFGNVSVLSPLLLFQYYLKVLST